MSAEVSATPMASKDAPPVALSASMAGGGAAGAGAGGAATSSDRPKAAGSVASTANQILFKNELYTSMKQKTMDHELMARFSKEAQETEKRKFEKAKIAVARLENKRKVLIGVGDLLGPPGSDPTTYSSASIAVALEPLDTVRDVKKKLISAAGWVDETPSDFGLFDDSSEEPLMDGQAIETAIAPGKPSSAGKSGLRRGGGSSRASATVRMPRPYVGVLWAARI